MEVYGDVDMVDHWWCVLKMMKVLTMNWLCGLDKCGKFGSVILVVALTKREVTLMG